MFGVARPFSAIALLAVLLEAAPAHAQVTDDQIAGWSDSVLNDIQDKGAIEIEQSISHCYGEVYGGRSDLVEECTTMHFTAAIIEREMAQALNMAVRDLYRDEVMAGVIATHFDRAGKLSNTATNSHPGRWRSFTPGWKNG